MQINWTTVQKRVNDLLPAEYNPRQMTEDQAKQLEKSLKKFGLAEIPAINVDGTILAGHQRMAMLKKLGKGDDLIDVRIPNRQLTDDEAKEYNLRSNKNTGEWDLDKLLAMDEDMLKDVGFDESFFDNLLNKDNKTAEEDDFEQPDTETLKTDIKLGDIIEIGEHRLMCGNATKLNDYTSLMDGAKAQMVLTDPPYNVAYVGKTKESLTIQNDSMADGDFYSFLLDFYKGAASVMAAGGGWYIWHADSEGMNFRKAMIDAGVSLKQCLIWVKNTLVMGRQDFHWKHEPCLYGWIEGEAHKWYSDRTQTTTLEFDRPTRNAEHPTMKPVPLFAYLLGCSSKKGDIILDPFLGSGTTMVAAHQLGRKCYGMELDPKYCQVIVNRMRSLDDTLTVKINNKVV